MRSSPQQVGEARAVEPLLTLLRDGNESVRGRAAIALASFGDLAAVAPLVEALKDQTLVQRRAVWALGKLNHSVAIEPLLDVVAFSGDWAEEEEAYAELAKLGVTRADAAELARQRAIDPDPLEAWNRACEAYRVELRRPRVYGAGRSGRSSS
jgi:HEAT repeat protein